MARVITGYYLPAYTDDFGNQYNNLFFKFGGGIPDSVLTALGLVKGQSTPCSGNVPFDHRYIEVIWENGRTNRIPVATRGGDTGIVATLNKIRGLNVTGYKLICANLEGEKWNLVTPKAYPDGAAPTFRNAPYSDISDVANRESLRFSYNSDVIDSTLQLGTTIEREPTSLNACQRECLRDVKTGQGICSAQATGIKPRFYTIQALGINPVDANNPDANPNPDTFRVIRQVKVSLRDSVPLRECIPAISSCAYCLSYKGESVNSLHNVV